MNKKIKISRTLLIPAIILGIWTGYTSEIWLKNDLAWQIGLGIAAAMMLYLVGAFLIKRFRAMMIGLDRALDRIAVESLAGGLAGLFFGVLVAGLSSYPLSQLQGPLSYATILVFLGAVFLGMRIGSRRASELLKLLPAGRQVTAAENLAQGHKKVLDNSAIIDGRIYDVCQSNFLQGPLIVPTFVIEELQHIADSSDHIRRSKGRRGLELLSKMQKHSEIEIDIIEANIPEEKEVDAKLVRLCKQINASIITNDYNLNKVSELQGIKVLNINQLANAVKVMVYPGENMHVNIIKEGKENGQGVGYLEDGTMIVVENAGEDIGTELEVTVTSVFQTAAGRMIFTRKVKEEGGGSLNHVFRDTQEVNLYG
ncbi:MAG: PIN/TRAM domain-containing protein [Deltaproteobacteria bacterium]